MADPLFFSPGAELAALRAEDARLWRLLDLTAEQECPPAAAHSGLFLDRPGPATASSCGPDKVRFLRTLFAARTDVYAIRWDSAWTGCSGWSPVVEGGWRKGTSGLVRCALCGRRPDSTWGRCGNGAEAA